MKKHPEIKSTEIPSRDWRASSPGISATVKSINSPTDNITVEMKYPSVQGQTKIKLGDAYPLRLEDDVETVINTLCDETPLTKATILRMCCRAGLRAIDWNKHKYQPLNLTGAEVKPASAKPAQPPAEGAAATPVHLRPVSLNICRHGVPETVFSLREVGGLIEAIGDLQCIWAIG